MARLILRSAIFEDGYIELSPFDLPATLGRSHRADVTISDGLLSRIHAKICVGEDGGFEIVDSDSTNLTIVNGKYVERASLKTGDNILLGETEILVEIDDPDNDLHEKTTRELPIVPEQKPAEPSGN